MKAIRWLDENLEQFLVSVFTLAMITVLGVNVLLRFVKGSSFSEAEELARNCFIYVVFLAASLAAQKDSHIRITAPTDALPKTAKRAVLVVADIIWLCFNVFVVIWGWRLVESMSQYPYRSPALEWNMQFMYAVIPLSFGCMSLRILQRYYRRVRYGWEREAGEREVVEL